MLEKLKKEDSGSNSQADIPVNQAAETMCNEIKKNLQELQKTLIPKEFKPTQKYSLKMLKEGELSESLGQERPSSEIAAINQCSNILEMEHRYEIPLIIGGSSRYNFYSIQDMLHNEILLFKCDSNMIMQEMSQVKEIMIKKITDLITAIFPTYMVSVYGSHATSLCLHWSDIDLVVGPRHEIMDIKESLRQVADKLKNEIENHWVAEVNYIENATVPVIKMKCSLSALMTQAGQRFPKNPKYKRIYNEMFSIDITHRTDFHNGLKCVDLVKQHLLETWFIEPLILVLKQMLKVNQLNDPYKGGLSSYGLFLMIAAFVQMRKFNFNRQPQNINLGNILLDFLHHYSEIFKPSEEGIRCLLPREEGGSNKNYYKIIPDINLPLFGASKVP